MFYTYKNCTVVLNDQQYVAANLSFNVSTQLKPRYYANRKYAHSFKPEGAIEADLSFSYFLTGTDHFNDIMYQEGTPVSGNFGQVLFPSGYLTSYKIGASPNTNAQATVNIKLFDYEGKLGSGTFTPNTSKPNQDKEIINFLDATINGTGLVDYNTSVTEASFSYSMDVDPVYNIRTGVGLNNLKPDSVRFGPKKLSSSITIDNMSGSLSMFGDNVLLGIGLRHRNSLERVAYFETRGFTDTKQIQGDNQSYAKNSITVTQEAPSILAAITGGGPTGAAVGETVIVSGVNFLSYPDVWIGDFELVEWEFISDTELRFIVPSPPPGEGSIVLKNGDQSNASYNLFKSLASNINITRIE